MEWDEGWKPRVLTRSGLVLACSDCGQSMVVRHNRTTGEPFIGCAAWPRCSHTEPLSEYFVKVARGDPRLPGF